MDWFLYNKNLRNERVDALLFACIQRDLFLDHEKIIGIHASKYQSRMLFINSLSKNETVETFKTTKTHKAYINFGIFS